MKRHNKDRRAHFVEGVEQIPDWLADLMAHHEPTAEEAKEWNKEIWAVAAEIRQKRNDEYAAMFYWRGPGRVEY